MNLMGNILIKSNFNNDSVGNKMKIKLYIYMHMFINISLKFSLELFSRIYLQKELSFVYLRMILKVKILKKKVF